MIEQISNFSRKSFKDYTSPANYFKKKMFCLDIMVGGKVLLH